ncbi:hypothetical protein SAY87_010924 [Trapa incisa]|uniref:Uncharacterized protein n=1 Tax=Trapa incisa TaxID=236973 RepID=A0AAN7GX74_9MYRT|nr:hypothetical protein SAY87_010924 [Trapa incisa]
MGRDYKGLGTTTPPISGGRPPTPVTPRDSPPPRQGHPHGRSAAEGVGEHSQCPHHPVRVPRGGHRQQGTQDPGPAQARTAAGRRH